MIKIEKIFTADYQYDVDNSRDGSDFNEHTNRVAGELGLECVSFYSKEHKAPVTIPIHKITAVVFEPEEEETND